LGGSSLPFTESGDEEEEEDMAVEIGLRWDPGEFFRARASGGEVERWTPSDAEGWWADGDIS
jgi:hypothetical protein